MTKLGNLSENKKESGENLPSEINPGNYTACCEACRKFDSCSSPICPRFGMDIWYPTDEICSLPEYSKETWVRNQKKIARKVRNKDFYFTYKMLCRNCVITVATEGLDPDKTNIDDEQQVERWLKEHPEKRILSDDERAELRERFSKVQGKQPDEKTA